MIKTSDEPEQWRCPFWNEVISECTRVQIQILPEFIPEVTISLKPSNTSDVEKFVNFITKMIIDHDNIITDQDIKEFNNLLSKLYNAENWYNNRHKYYEMKMILQHIITKKKTELSWLKKAYSESKITIKNLREDCRQLRFHTCDHLDYENSLRGKLGLAIHYIEDDSGNPSISKRVILKILKEY